MSLPVYSGVSGVSNEVKRFSCKNRKKVKPVKHIYIYKLNIPLTLELMINRGGLGSKSLRGNRFYNGDRDIAEKTSCSLKKNLNFT
jgi:hypothetical protein